MSASSRLNRKRDAWENEPPHLSPMEGGTMFAEHGHADDGQDDGPDNEAHLAELLSNLQLPRMSLDERPTLRILAVADIDLASAAALAEFALTAVGLEAGQVDLCIACGPFARDDDVKKHYLQGRSRRKDRSKPRTREETAALEGLMTGALSQLESIVCRVVFCPHPTDPSTTLSKPEPSRMTPNSRNIHRHWLQLVPGLGCTGLASSADRCSTEDSSLHSNCGCKCSHTLSELVDLAPLSFHPSPRQGEDPFPFATPKSQAILVTTVPDSTSFADQDEPQNYTNPLSGWPHEHLNFLDSGKGQAQVVLHVASLPLTHTPFDTQRGNIRVVMPGSLREHGNFALIDVALCQDKQHNATSTPTSRRLYSWRVNRVQFRNMHRV